MRVARKDNIQVVCMLPSQLAWLLWEFGKAKHKATAEHLLKFSPITSYLHSCANPIIYGTLMAFFRKKFQLRLRKCILYCHRFMCVLRRGKIHRFQVSSSRREVSRQHYNRKASNDSANSKTRDGPANMTRKENLDIEIGAQRNFGFIKETRL